MHACARSGRVSEHRPRLGFGEGRWPSGKEKIVLSRIIDLRAVELDNANSWMCQNVDRPLPAHEQNVICVLECTGLIEALVCCKEASLIWQNNLAASTLDLHDA